MTIVFMLIPIALLLGMTFLVGFIFAAGQGQFDDLETPPNRILLDDEPAPAKQDEKGITT
jgi:cbb3-type cytochrome oxidase maturation protein